MSETATEPTVDDPSQPGYFARGWLMRDQAGPVPRPFPGVAGVRSRAATGADPFPWPLVRDLLGVVLIVLGCLTGDGLAWAYGGVPAGAGVLAGLAVVAGVVLGRI